MGIPALATRPGEGIFVDLSGPDQPVSLRDYVRTEPWNPQRHRALSAAAVAKVIVATFAGTIVFSFLTLILILIVSPNPETAKRFTDVLIALLEGLGKFLAAVFGPLLAFVLGYYFSEKQQ